RTAADITDRKAAIDADQRRRVRRVLRLHRARARRLARAVDLTRGVPRLPCIRRVDQRDDAPRPPRDHGGAGAARLNIGTSHPLESVPVPCELEQPWSAAFERAGREAEIRERRVDLQRRTDDHYRLVICPEIEHPPPRRIPPTP